MQITRTTRFLRTILQLRHILLTEARTFISLSLPDRFPARLSAAFRLPCRLPAARCRAYRTTPVRP